MSQSQIIFGFHPIVSQLRQSSRSIQEIYLDSDRNDPRAKEIIELAKENNIRILMVDRARLDRKRPKRTSIFSYIRWRRRSA